MLRTSYVFLERLKELRKFCEKAKKEFIYKLLDKDSTDIFSFNSLLRDCRDFIA